MSSKARTTSSGTRSGCAQHSCSVSATARRGPSRMRRALVNAGPTTGTE